MVFHGGCFTFLCFMIQLRPQFYNPPPQLTVKQLFSIFYVLIQDKTKLNYDFRHFKIYSDIFFGLNTSFINQLELIASNTVICRVKQPKLIISLITMQLTIDTINKLRIRST